VIPEVDEQLQKYESFDQIRIGGWLRQTLMCR